MKKIFVFITALTLIVLNIYAQDAQSILEKTTAKIQSAKGINVSFSLTQKNKSGQIISSSKGILKAKDTKYYIKQNGNEIFCNGVQVWNYDGEHEVTVTKAEYDDELSPQQIITGFNKKDFTASLLSSSATNYQIQLMPVDKRKNFKQVVVTINKPTNLISKAVLTDKTNNVIEIRFSNISLNTTIPDSQFAFEPSKHPGVEVINQ